MPIRLNRHVGLYCLSSLLTGITLPLAAQQQPYFEAAGRKINSKAFDEAIEKMMEISNVPGVSLAIIDNNRVAYYSGYGYRKLSEKTRVDSNTVFEAASLSKSFLVYAAFKLVEAGKLDLDKPMYEYRDPGAPLNKDPRYKLITPRMILSHCSGIENWQRYNNPDVLEIVSEPGKQFVYSGTGYNLLADVMTTILGEPYEAYIKRLVIDPLGLKNTFLRFTSGNVNGFYKETPADFAVGHDSFGKDLGKWKNREAVPASGNNVTAADYATLLISLFDRQHFTDATTATLLRPVIRLGETADYSGYYGTGFEIHYVPGDTIIAHGGDNTGFKNQVFYSITQKRGFVLLTNSERGKLLSTAISALSVDLPIRELCRKNFIDQYPSPAIDLFNVYRKDGKAPMLAALQQVKAKQGLDSNTLCALGMELVEKDIDLSRQLFEEEIRRQPTSATAYGFLAEVCFKQKQYDSSLAYYTKARTMHFKWWNIDNKLTQCEDKIKEQNRRPSLLATIDGAASSRVLANDYNAMQGVESGPIPDSGTNYTVTYVNTGSWLDYKVSVDKPGTYQVAFRVASKKGGNKLLLQSDGKVLASIAVASTTEWRNWNTLTAQVQLPPGKQLLRLTASGDGGGFIVSWIRFSPVDTSTAQTATK
ncbi:serine hydrolase [Chitinophaga nivalis]|uniref:Serine hydrolase n=1 Tax=Chitinophaga nivalis TaxID=2991709 RepID=A0ABT3IJV5_9BACT|nr:serine hydrolase [Chitinophaga nivalis]MCW3466080.1 serine hydrolase [Chitinophaga nivalis]MCW3484229.1 serine hydrolase [Chitinophaga nivalis]